MNPINNFVDLTNDQNHPGPNNPNQNYRFVPSINQQLNGNQYSAASNRQRNDFIAASTQIPGQIYVPPHHVQTPNTFQYISAQEQLARQGSGNYSQMVSPRMMYQPPPPPPINNYGQNMSPYIQNMANRQQITNRYSSGYVEPATAHQQLAPRIKCTFSLVTPEEFTIRVEEGTIPINKFNQLRRIDLLKFDWENKRFLFPITRHDTLYVSQNCRFALFSLQKSNFSASFQSFLKNKLDFEVEPIPRAVINAASLKLTSTLLHGNQDQNASEQEKELKLNRQLSTHMPKYILNSLANFQKEAILFILEKNGRALVGDEMGLGKTRTGIAASYVYAKDWPVLIVSPSSARHHWHAEIIAVLVSSRQGGQQQKEEEDEEEHKKKTDDDGGNSWSENDDRQMDEDEDDEVVILDDYKVKKEVIVLDDLESPEKEMKIEPNANKNEKKEKKKSFLTPKKEFPVVNESDIILIEKANHFQLKSVEEHLSSAYKYYIISYSLISKLMSFLQQIPFNVILCDESHYIKSRQAKRTQSLVPFIQQKHRAILLSGTPALSRPLELYTQLNALLPKQWNDFKSFAKRYCQDSTNKQLGTLNKMNKINSTNSLFSNQKTKFSKFGDNAYKGANHTQELHFILTSTIMIRRLKKDILKSLPKKKRYLMKIPITNPEKDSHLKDMLSTLAKYEELITKKTFHKKKLKAQQKKSKSSSDIPDDNIDEFGLEGSFTAQQDEELLELKEKRKNMLMKLFHESGEIKLEAILPKLNMFFNDKFSGKVKY
jgi:hypothetical protein